jgi:hypothetical protein
LIYIFVIAHRASLAFATSSRAMQTDIAGKHFVFEVVWKARCLRKLKTEKGGAYTSLY